MSEELTDRPEQWPVTASRDIHHDDWVVRITMDTLHRPGESDDSFERLAVHHPGAVMVLAVDEDDRACCIRQYRHVVGRNLVELPAGICDQAGEPPLETAKRELREEAQLRADDWRPLVTVWPTPGLTDEVHHLYLARGLSVEDRGDFELQHEETSIEVLWVPVTELVDGILSGRLQQGPLAVAVLAFTTARAHGSL